MNKVYPPKVDPEKCNTAQLWGADDNGTYPPGATIPKGAVKFEVRQPEWATFPPCHDTIASWVEGAWRKLKAEAATEQAEVVEDLTPTWEASARILLAAYRNGSRTAEDELMRMARTLDQAKAELERLREITNQLKTI